ncbi:MAG: prepilin-type N-terminal cleavage/methylation domain-containing protein [Idiomarina sp.]|nr:prepilin-type N-terminal cleavage/methylation domain-containing protein [Idiomarina sp.]
MANGALNKGFTLIEVALALALSVIGGMALLQAQSHVAYLYQQARANGKAVAMLERQYAALVAAPEQGHQPLFTVSPVEQGGYSFLLNLAEVGPPMQQQGLIYALPTGPEAPFACD